MEAIGPRLRPGPPLLLQWLFLTHSHWAPGKLGLVSKFLLHFLKYNCIGWNLSPHSFIERLSRAFWDQDKSLRGAGQGWKGHTMQSHFPKHGHVKAKGHLGRGRAPRFCLREVWKCRARNGRSMRTGSLRPVLPGLPAPHTLLIEAVTLDTAMKGCLTPFGSSQLSRRRKFALPSLE